MNGIVIIPARLKSTRLPEIPLADIHGKSMIQHVYERCCIAIERNNVYVATDSERIRDEVHSFGGNIVMTSDKCLTGTDRIAEANEIINADFVINVQGDEPMINPNDVKLVHDAMIKDSSNILNCFCKIHEDEIFMPSVPKVVISNSNKLIYMSRSGIPFNKNMKPFAKYKQVCIYGFNKNHLKIFTSQSKKTNNELVEDLEILRFLDLDVSVKMIQVSEGGIAVDTPQDLERVRASMKIEIRNA